METLTARLGNKLIEEGVVFQKEGVLWASRLDDELISEELYLGTCIWETAKKLGEEPNDFK